MASSKQSSSIANGVSARGRGSISTVLTRTQRTPREDLPVLDNIRFVWPAILPKQKAQQTPHLAEGFYQRQYLRCEFCDIEDYEKRKKSSFPEVREKAIREMQEQPKPREKLEPQSFASHAIFLEHVLKVHPDFRCRWFYITTRGGESDPICTACMEGRIYDRFEDAAEHHNLPSCATSILYANYSVVICQKSVSQNVPYIWPPRHPIPDLRETPTNMLASPLGLGDVQVSFPYLGRGRKSEQMAGEKRSGAYSKPDSRGGEHSNPAAQFEASWVSHQPSPTQSRSPSPPCVASDSEASFVFNTNSPASDSDDLTESKPQYDKIVHELVQDFLSIVCNEHKPQDKPPEKNTNAPRDDSSSTKTARCFSSCPEIISLVRKSSPEEDEEEGSRRLKRPKANESTSNLSTGKLLACPYAKSDPSRYSEANCIEKDYRACASRYLTDIARLKQHLYRVHRRPSHHCSSCFTTFKSETELDAHMRIRPACSVIECPFGEKMTTDQQSAIKRREMGKSRVKAWYDIYEILFPGASLPDDPYVDNSSSKMLDQFLVYFERHAPSRLSNAVMADLYGNIPTSDQLREHTNRVLEDCMTALIQNMREEFRQGTREFNADDGGRSVHFGDDFVVI